MDTIRTESEINVTDITTMSAKYRYDGDYPKFDYKPERFDYPDGWSFFHHPGLLNAKDEAFSNGNYFQLFNNVIARDISYVRNLSASDMVIWAALKAHNGKYLKTKSDAFGARVFAITSVDDTSQLTYENIYRIIKMDDGRFMISQGSKYMTVVVDGHNRFEIHMEDEVESDPKGIQHFGVERTRLNNGVMFYSLTKNIWDAKKWRQSTVMRYFSIFDNYNHTNGIAPKTVNIFPRLYKNRIEDRNSTEFCDMLMCVGNVHNPKYGKDEQNVPGLNTVGNFCVFQIADNIGNLGIVPIGYDGKIRWVNYHNDFKGSFFNKDTTTNFVFEGVRPSVLYEVPYEYGTTESQMASSVTPSGWIPDASVTPSIAKYAIEHQKTAAIENNPIELKSIMTSEYTYTDAGKELIDGQ